MASDASENTVKNIKINVNHIMFHLESLVQEQN